MSTPEGQTPDAPDVDQPDGGDGTGNDGQTPATPDVDQPDGGS